MEDIDPGAMLIAGIIVALIMAVVGALCVVGWSVFTTSDPHAWICGHCRERFAQREEFIEHECKRGFVDA